MTSIFGGHDNQETYGWHFDPNTQSQRNGQAFGGSNLELKSGNKFQ
jgi:hypothetical protein